MPFSKSFPKKTKASAYPQWEEISLTESEEKFEEERTRLENVRLMKQCIDDAKSLVKEKSMREYQTDIVHIAIALFEKRASHTIFWKESKAKEKFDKAFKE